MSNENLVIQLYWGGKIVSVGGSISYDPPRCNKVLFLRKQIHFDELVNRIYTLMELDRNAFKMNLLVRNCVATGFFTGMPLEDDNGMEVLYFMKSNSPQVSEIYVEVEELPCLGPNDIQVAETTCTQFDRATCSYEPEQVNLAGTTSFCSNQLSESDCGRIQSSKRRCTRGSAHQNQDRPNSSQAVEHVGLAENLTMEKAILSTPATNIDVDLVDVEVNSESELDGDESNDDDHDYDASRQDGVPHIPDLLVLQSQHRSQAICFGTNNLLSVKRCDGSFWHYLSTLDARIAKYIDLAGFQGVRQASTVQLDHHLITALIERWRQETHTFHLPVGETTVTLQDVEVLWGLRVDGLPVTLVEKKRSRHAHKELIQELLGFWPDDNCFKDGRLKLTAFSQFLDTTLPDDASDELIRQHARMYILILFAGQLFGDACGNVVSLHWLDAVRDLEAMGQYSWGSAVLATLYSRMCHASNASTRSTAGPYMLLQLWAWERLPTIRPTIVTPVQPGNYPRGRRWATERTGIYAPQHVLPYYRDQLSKLRFNQFIWEPYSADVLSSLPAYCTAGSHIWRSKVPLIFWHIVELHLPNRVLRQFGMCQPIPDDVNTSTQLHQLGRSGFPGRDWGAYHITWVNMWQARANSVVSGHPSDTHMPSYKYMRWYRQRTILHITPSIARQPQHEGHPRDAGQHK